MCKPSRYSLSNLSEVGRQFQGVDSPSVVAHDENRVGPVEPDVSELGALHHLLLTQRLVLVLGQVKHVYLRIYSTYSTGETRGLSSVGGDTGHSLLSRHWSQRRILWRSKAPRPRPPPRCPSRRRGQGGGNCGPRSSRSSRRSRR